MKLLKTFLVVSLLLSNFSSIKAETLKTSFYNRGKITASGEKFNPTKNTAASNHYKFGTILQLSYNGRTEKVCVNDTGGFGKYNRDLDVSQGVAKKLNFTKSGVVKLQSMVVYKPKKKISCQKAWGMYASL